MTETTVDEKPRTDMLETAVQHMKAGKYREAADIYSDFLDEKFENSLFSGLTVCRVKETGELDKELGPLYLNYGKCLLRCAQQDLDVLGGISLEHNTNNPLVPAARKAFILTLIYNFLATGKVIETGAVASDSEDEENDENNVNEAADTLELAWQILETARVILADNPQSLSEVYFLLGDLSMESGIAVIT